MKYLSVAIIIIVFACFSFSQTSGISASSASSSSDSKPATVATSVNGGKVTIPPEKARPVSIPKMTAAITIDGKIDEELWKTAAVFKNFYQTGPG